MEPMITWAELVANAHDEEWFTSIALTRPLAPTFFRDLALHVWSVDERLSRLERQ